MSRVSDNSFDTTKVAATPNKITSISISAVASDVNGAITTPAKKIVISDIMAGNLPLHGTKELVIMAINRSRGESIIRHPVTPQALQPKPIHMVSC